MNINDIFEIKIEKMANEGKGLGRIDERVVFVPFSAPGDLLKIKISKISKTFCEAEIVQIIEPSQLRTQPPCPYYGQCGGCNLQHIKYTYQLRLKTELVKETLARFLKIPNLPFLESVPAPHPFNYRNRIQMHCQGQLLGFNKRKSHDVLNIENCLIAEEQINHFIKKFRNSPEFILPQKSPEKNSPESNRFEFYLTPDLSVGIRNGSEESLAFFSQVNRFQNENLISAVMTAFKDSPNTQQNNYFDLYAGAGNFSFPLAELKNKASVFAVESSPDLIKIGKEKTLDQQKDKIPKTIKFIQSSVEYFLAHFEIKSEDLILLDPPRVGCAPEAMQILGSKRRSKVMYISCDHVTLSRDLALMSVTAQKWGLRVDFESFQCFDMFPQTDHIEVCVVLSVS